MENKQLNIYFGAMCDTIAEQLRKQRFNFEGAKVKCFQDCSHHITYLLFQGVATESQVKKMRDKLFVLIKQHIQIKNQ